MSGQPFSGASVRVRGMETFGVQPAGGALLLQSGGNLTAASSQLPQQRPPLALVRVACLGFLLGCFSSHRSSVERSLSFSVLRR